MNLKHCEVMQYVEYLSVNVDEVISKYSTIKKYAYILHDKDTNEDGSAIPPHYHIYLHFGGASVSTGSVAKWFGIKDQYVSKIKGREKDILLYLTHRNVENKFVYDFAEVKTNFSNFEQLCKEFLEEKDIYNDILFNWDKYSYSQMLKYVDTLPPKTRIKITNQLAIDYKRHCLTKSTETNRNLKVIFIYGDGGVGKTYIAKKLLDGLGLDFCISSSSNDLFQDYLGQKAIILDDMRDTSFKFYDLLKILDNDTKSSVSSRFVNKTVDCQYIVITSSLPITRWYKTLSRLHLNEDLSSEDFYQLYRRIGCYVIVREDCYFVYNGLDKNGHVIGSPSVFENEVYKLKKEKSNNGFDYSTLFSNVSKKISLEDTFYDEKGNILQEMSMFKNSERLITDKNKKS